MTAVRPTRLLLVDDEVPLLRLLERYLGRLGFEVQACSEAEEALELFEADPDAYPLVMVDLNLPGMSGEELLGKILGASRSTRALVCSGYPVNPARFPETVQGRLSFLQKPFAPRMLAEMLRELLEREQDGAARAAAAGLPQRKAD